MDAVISLGERVGNLESSNEVIIKTVLSLSEQVDATPEIMRGMIDDAKEEILEEIRPIARAVDRDAEMIINHEKRITRVETQLVAAKI